MTKPFLLTVSALLLFSTTSLQAQTFAGMTQTPVIDGLRDGQFRELPLNRFGVTEKSAETNPDLEAGYLTAYDANHLYLYIEVEAEGITARDRGYQNGDGFHMTIGKPLPDGAPTDEFYVLGFSAGAEGRWFEKMVWYYNTGLNFETFGDDVAFATGESDGVASFELLLPWARIRPYHPWFFGRIGFNLCFVKAVGETEANYYYVKYDKRFQWEQSPREYEIAEFGRTAAGIASRLPAGNLPEGGKLPVEYAWQDANGALSHSGTVIDLAGMPQGDYTLDGNPFTILPEFDPAALRMEIEEYREALSEGSEATLDFYVTELSAELATLKSYETASVLRKKINALEALFGTLRSGGDPLAGRTGTYRRAYRAGGELFPYSIHLPADWSPDKTYPLLVFLHGSGQDDRALAGNPNPGGFIVAAPNGRDVSNCFATSEAQLDIRRVIEDVEANFKIDPRHVLLSGFSMGGYGVYRTFWEDPERYCALAILSGHPDLGSQWGGDPKMCPDFTQERNLGKFTTVPIFVYHTRGDVNCPYELTAGVVEKLRVAGADVTFAVNDGGHGTMPADIVQNYFEWLRRLTTDGRGSDKTERK